MAQIAEIGVPVAKVFAVMIAGFLIFRIQPVRQTVRPLLFVTLNILFPIHLIYKFSDGWGQAVEAGWQWMAVFFFASLLMMGIQLVAGVLLVKKTNLLQTNYEREIITFFWVHNAGYIPIPILTALAPKGLMVFMFFYFFAFNIVFWSAAASYISPGEGKRFRFKLNMPLIGLIVGFFLAVTGLFSYIPPVIRTSMQFIADYSIYVILFLVGSIVGTIPMRHLKIHRVFRRFIGIKMIIYPVIVLGLTLLLPLKGLSRDMAAGIKLALVIEAAVPPATNILITTKAYGSEEQVRFVGSGIMATYLAALVTLPVFILLIMLWR